VEVVPPTTISHTEPDVSVQRLVALFAMTTEVEQALRDEAHEAVASAT
jgi:hypothetical protein